MTRVPKFRAWHKYSETMYEVKSIVYTLMRALGVNQAALYPERTLELDDDSAILMQSTGLKDKNGVEIYEGDIVDINNGEVVTKVYFAEGAFCLDLLNGGVPIHAFGGHQLEVIGNVYENKELLEEVKEGE